MKQTAKCYSNYFLLYFKNLNQYKFNWFVSLIRIPFILILYWFLWKTIYHYHNSPLGSYEFNHMMVYLITVQWVAMSVSLKVSEKIAGDIRSGKLSIYLARPIHYLPTQLATFLASWSFNIFITTIPFLVLLYVINGSWFSLIQYGVFILSLFSAGILYFLLECCFGMSSFWFNKIFGLQFFVLTFFDIAGGKLIPLTLFPSWFQKLSFLSPLRVIYYEPISLLFGGSLVKVLMMQALWIICLSGLLVFLWNQGKAVYEAYG